MSDDGWYIVSEGDPFFEWQKNRTTGEIRYRRIAEYKPSHDVMFKVDDPWTYARRKPDPDPLPEGWGSW